MPGVYVLGDVKGGPAFTHIAYDDFRVIRANLLQGGDRTTSGRLVPYVIFSDPQFGRVGLTEREARESVMDIATYSMPMQWVGTRSGDGRDPGLHESGSRHGRRMHPRLRNTGSGRAAS